MTTGKYRAISADGRPPRAHRSRSLPSASTWNASLGFGSLDVGSLEVGAGTPGRRSTASGTQSPQKRPAAVTGGASSNGRPPRTQELWESLPPEEQLRFCRHVDVFLTCTVTGWRRRKKNRSTSSPTPALSVISPGAPGPCGPFETGSSSYKGALSLELATVPVGARPGRSTAQGRVASGVHRPPYLRREPPKVGLGLSVRRLGSRIHTDAGGRATAGSRRGRANGCGHSGRSARANCSKVPPCPRSGHRHKK